MTILETASNLIKKILNCNLHGAEDDGVNINDERQTSIRSNNEAHRTVSSTNQEQLNVTNIRLPQNRNVQVSHDLIVIEDNDPSRYGYVRIPSTRSSQRHNLVVEKLSKTFKEYVERQLEDLTAETLSFKGTTNNTEYNRLQRRIGRELEGLQEMDISDKTLENKWKTQVKELREILQHNAKMREQQSVVILDPIKAHRSAAPRHEAIVPVHQSLISKQNELKTKLDIVHRRLIALSDRVFDFCSDHKTREYIGIEDGINFEVNSLKRSNAYKEFPLLIIRKSEIEQYGSIWLMELQRRLTEMQIRRYEARVKALW